MVPVEIIYIPKDQPIFHQRLSITAGSTVRDALKQSSVFHQFPEAAALDVAIFSKRIDLDDVVQSGDRIELLRPLALDPKENRRQRAKRR